MTYFGIWYKGTGTWVLNNLRLPVLHKTKKAATDDLHDWTLPGDHRSSYEVRRYPQRRRVAK